MHFIIDWERTLEIFRRGVCGQSALSLAVVHPKSFVVLHLGLAIVSKTHLQVLISQAAPLLKRGSLLVDGRSNSPAWVRIEL